MQKMMEKRALELLADGTVNRVLGWSAGDFIYDVTPAVFKTAEEVQDKFLYNDFCGANLSKYLVRRAARRARSLSSSSPATPTASIS